MEQLHTGIISLLQSQDYDNRAVFNESETYKTRVSECKEFEKQNRRLSSEKPLYSEVEKIFLFE